MRGAVLQLKIPDNWMTELLQERDMRIRIFGFKPCECQCWSSLMRISLNENLDTILDSIRRHKTVLGASFSAVSGHDVMGEVCDRNAAYTALNLSDCFMVSLISGNKGWLELIVAGGSNSAIENLIELLERYGCGVKLERVSAYSSNGLTQRQDEILQFAVSNGYFEYPKRIKLRELSQIFDVSASTMSEILRAGERRVFSEYFGLY